MELSLSCYLERLLHGQYLTKIFLLVVVFFFFQIDEDLEEENAKKLLNQEIDLDKPGNAQFYCLHCA